MTHPFPASPLADRPKPWVRWTVTSIRRVLLIAFILTHAALTYGLTLATNHLGPVYWHTPWWDLPALSQGVDVGWGLAILIFLVPGLPELWQLGLPADQYQLLWPDVAVTLGPLLALVAYEFLVYRPFRARHPLPTPGLLASFLKATRAFWKMGRVEVLSRLT